MMQKLSNNSDLIYDIHCVNCDAIYVEICDTTFLYTQIKQQSMQGCSNDGMHTLISNFTFTIPTQVIQSNRWNKLYNSKICSQCNNHWSWCSETEFVSRSTYMTMSPPPPAGRCHVMKEISFSANNFIKCIRLQNYWQSLVMYVHQGVHETWVTKQRTS